MPPHPTPPDVERRRPFLTARWSNIITLTFPVTPRLVAARLPPGVEPDLRGGLAHVSVAAFDFLDTRIRGRRFPGFVNFPEVNLRAYARQGDRRGIVLLRELVPSRLAAAIARLRFNEPFRSTPMESRTAGIGSDLVVEHRWRWEDRRFHVRVTASQGSELPVQGGIEEYVLGRWWAFGQTRTGAPRAVRVQHPVWSLRRIKDVDYDIEFGALYGAEWAELNRTPPVATLLAVGSAVSVFPPGR